ncbi:MAG TPA: 2,3-diaminopropionate biosynthesis protein SbnB [Pyrinomonadaceae bacterium]|jgi:ornithine cyclodeaminase
MYDDDLLILKGHEVLSLLAGREAELIRTVGAAYQAHAEGDSSLPHSTFLRFPADQRNRIIALPAYLGEEFGVAGIKWVSSFPGNLALGLDRASAVVILNSPQTGRPEAIIEGSIISAKRTAASAALAAQLLQQDRPTRRAAFLGCGLINFEIARSLMAACPDLTHFVVYDLDAARAAHFAQKCAATFAPVTTEVAPDLASLLRAAPLISMATTAGQPYINELDGCAPGSTILHISLRDLAPELILAGDNIVDDVDHVCRAQTSIHLTEQLVGHRDFVRCTLADILRGHAPARRDADSIAIFSPFGLGVLDLAVSKLVRDLALAESKGSRISSFLPAPWLDGGAAQSEQKV